jgi:hypothetical protein
MGVTVAVSYQNKEGVNMAKVEGNLSEIGDVVPVVVRNSDKGARVGVRLRPITIAPRAGVRVVMRVISPVKEGIVKRATLYEER